jgi:hypothetical protein
MNKMVSGILVLASIIMITGCAGGGDDKQGLVLTNGWRYNSNVSQAENLKTIHIQNSTSDGTIGEIFNDSDTTTGSLVLALVFSHEPYKGGDDMVGYILWKMDYNPLAPGESISHVASTQNFDMPPVGDYYLYLILAEYSIQDGTYHIRDNIDFHSMIRVTGTWNMDTLD